VAVCVLERALGRRCCSNGPSTHPHTGPCHNLQSLPLYISFTPFPVLPVWSYLSTWLMVWCSSLALFPLAPQANQPFAPHCWMDTRLILSRV
jgi:hypothetical protein